MKSESTPAAEWREAGEPDPHGDREDPEEIDKPFWIVLAILAVVFFCFYP